MKKYIIITIVGSFFSTTFAMKTEHKQIQEDAFKYLPEELKTGPDLQAVLQSIDKAKDLTEAMNIVTKLNAQGEHTSLFNNDEFIRAFINYLDRKFRNVNKQPYIAQRLALPAISHMKWENNYNQEEQLLSTINKGNVDQVKDFIEKQKWNPNRNFGQSTLLGRAAYTGHLPIVQYLVERGADVNKPDNRGFTPLMSATLGGHKNIVEFLLNKGANPNTQDDYGYRTIRLTEQPEILKLLTKR